MTTAATIGLGTLAKLWDLDASPPAFKTLAEVTSIDGISLTRDIVDVTHMESPDGYREKIAGLKDPGEMTVEMNLVPGSASHLLLLAAFEDGVKRKFRVVFPSPSSIIWECDVLVSGVENSNPLDDKRTMSVTLAVSGKPNFAAT